MSDHEHSQTVERLCDVAIIGGSAAGLAAALQLVRQQRSVIVVDNDSPRNAPAPHMHAYLGYEGASPRDLITAGRDEVRSYGGEVLTGTALDVIRDGDRFRVQLSGGHSLLARRVLIATGLVDELPSVDGIERHWGTSVINCPFCHGFEVRDQRVVQVVTSAASVHTVALWRDLALELTLVVQDGSITEDDMQQLRDSGARVIEGTLASLVDGGPGGLSAVVLADGQSIDADAVVITPRFHARDQAVTGVGVDMAEHPSGLGRSIAVDFLGATSVDGVYAAGNVADPTLQVLPAAAHGSRVGAAISLSLATEGNGSETTDWDRLYSGDQVWSGRPNGTMVNEVSSLSPGRALDVGAGEGGDAVWLAQQGWQVTATDVSVRALEKVARHCEEAGVVVHALHQNAATLDAFPTEAFDLVSMQYGAVPRSPDQRGVHNLINAVAPGGTLLVVAHDLLPMREPIDTMEQTRMWDPDAFVGIDEITAMLKTLSEWKIVLLEKRRRPHGGASTHHVEDVVLRATRIGPV